jgi:GNAT superfamily N-acetyltransferase
MVVREATKKDINQLSRLFDLYRVYFKQKSDPETGATFLQERMERKESVIYVSDDEGELAGFVQLYPLFSSVRLKRIWMLNDLFVLPEYRGKQISKQLIDKAKQLARETGAAGILLETEKTNEIGNHVYPAAGFERYEETNFYWWTKDS